MRRPGGSTVVTLGVALFLGSLSLVMWRQARAMETHAETDSLRREQALARADGEELRRRIQVLESRGRVVPEANRRLGMEIAPGTILLSTEAAEQ
jgi:hypothetical protein